MNLLKFLVICCFSLPLSAQKNVFLNIAPVFESQAFYLLQDYTGNDGVKVEIEHFNYYLSEIKLFHDGGQALELQDQIWLLTPSQYSLYLGFLNVNHIDSIVFTIGVPKPYNTQAGLLAQDISTYPETHPLSFQSPSMYWGWAFGYMHMIIGGKADSNNDNIPDAYFELHNLGNNNQQEVSLPCIQTNLGAQIDLNFECHVDRWLNQMPLSSVGVLHGETGLNQQILENVNTQEVFSLNEEASLISNEAPGLVKLLHNDQSIQLLSSQSQLITGFQLYSNSGQQLIKQSSLGSTVKINTNQLPAGLYFLKVELNNSKIESLRFVKP